MRPCLLPCHFHLLSFTHIQNITSLSLDFANWAIYSMYSCFLLKSLSSIDLQILLPCAFFLWILISVCRHPPGSEMPQTEYNIPGFLKSLHDFLVVKPAPRFWKSACLENSKFTHSLTHLKSYHNSAFLFIGLSFPLSKISPPFAVPRTSCPFRRC